MNKIRINIRKISSEVEVWVGHDLLKKLKPSQLKFDSKRAFLFGDSKLKEPVIEFSELLKRSGWSTEVRFVQGSESLKILKNLEPLYQWLLSARADRDSVIFAIGGGTVGDAIGFLAGTYLRGLRWVSLPSTLLAQVDSGVGGKTGLNHSLGKNLIGVFHQPSVVICDLSLLKTLPKREFISGLGEIIKYGLILDSSFYNYLRRNLGKLLDRDPRILNAVVSQCVKWKAVCIENDEFDRNGSRALLNFGHTLGHLFEAETQYQCFRHGEAVIWGMRGAAYLSFLRGNLSAKIHLEIDSFLSCLEVPSLLKGNSFSKRLRILSADKKTRNGNLNFVLLAGIGKALANQKVEAPEVRQALSWLHNSMARRARS